jgi:hypothetical protein
MIRRVLVAIKRATGVVLSPDQWNMVAEVIQKYYDFGYDNGVKHERTKIKESLKKSGKLPPEYWQVS